MATSTLQTPIAARTLSWFGAFPAALETRLETERERLPLWLPVAFGAGIALWFALPTAAQWIGLLCALAGGMAFGLAVVVSDAGASPELVRDGVDGRVVPAGDPLALGRVLAEWAADDARRVALARAGRDVVRERFSHEAFLDELERSLQALVPPA